MASLASDELVLYAIENFVDLSLWRDIHRATRPSQMPNWLATDKKTPASS